MLFKLIIYNLSAIQGSQNLFKNFDDLLLLNLDPSNFFSKSSIDPPLTHLYNLSASPITLATS